MNRIVPVIASAILLTAASTSLATAELKLDTRHDIVPVATHSAPPQPERTAEAAKTVPQTATPTQVAVADHQAKAAEPKPRPKKVQRKVRPRYGELEQIIVVRPVYRPIFAGYRFGRRW